LQVMPIRRNLQTVMYRIILTTNQLQKNQNKLIKLHRCTIVF
jgi:hypothetical protein